MEVSIGLQATMEWEAQDEGFMAKILVDAGTKDISVGTPVAVVCEEKDDVSTAAVAFPLVFLLEMSIILLTPAPEISLVGLQ